MLTLLERLALHHVNTSCCRTYSSANSIRMHARHSMPVSPYLLMHHGLESSLIGALRAPVVGDAALCAASRPGQHHKLPACMLSTRFHGPPHLPFPTTTDLGPTQDAHLLLVTKSARL